MPRYDSVTREPIKLPVRSPSVKALVERLKITADQANAIKKAADNGTPIRALRIADKAMNTYGVESGYPEYPELEYVNVGDSYALTLYYNGNTLLIGTWGDYVERHKPKPIGYFGKRSAPYRLTSQGRIVKKTDALIIHRRGSIFGSRR